ncbi:VID72-domain protein [Monoraphidium neglectum]|uniref:VID72-domain protein n=1 Tax=Monoraphidium neglectum TaxID=145388 RepID=A0A0D2KX45_9CHLO|nr:VID72-domain protein [Monoraphidium neglectum]KIY99868.1 VID72-domain protein [Monoraphidium neglectum]|eukprot:XP_013898888.1 VID72-domain protein [Monoraphidium neglectum]
MGNTTSTDALQEAVDEVEQQQAGEAQAPPGIKLYEFVRAASGAASWSLLSGHAAPTFYDANGEGGGGGRSKPEWMLEIDAGDVDARADEALQYVADRGARRVTFAAGGRLFALRFPDDAGFGGFMEDLESKVFTNTYGFEDDDAGRDKVLGDFRDMFFKGGGEHPRQATQRTLPLMRSRA